MPAFASTMFPNSFLNNGKSSSSSENPNMNLQFSHPHTSHASGNSSELQSSMAQANSFLGNPFVMQQQGDFHNAASMQDASAFLSQGSQFVPELDMMALLRAKQKLNLMNRAASVQDKYKAFAQDQFKGQGMAMTDPDSLHVSSALIDNLKRSAVDMTSSHRAPQESKAPKSKRRKKATRASDMPRRALSAYNIFFSEQRQLILKEIEAKENPKGGAEKEEADGKPSEPEAKKEDKKEDKKEEKLPSVMNRTFFPTRAKRAHRKVHGKIGLVQLARTVSQRWKALSPEKRKQYQDLAEQDRQRHKEVMREYQERKTAENMISMNSPEQEPEEAPETPVPPLPSQQELRESMAHQYQQRILAEMMAARQQQQQQQQQPFQQQIAMNAAAMMPQSFNALQAQQQAQQQANLGLDPNMLQLNALQNQARAQMWKQMGMGPM